MRPVSMWFWVILAACVAGWFASGIFLQGGNVPANDLFDVASLSAFAAALAFAVIYTVAGFTGPAKWWKNDVGTYLVLAAVSVLFIVGPVSFAVMFHHGLIDTFWWVWAWIGGHFFGAVIWALLAGLWLRRRKTGGFNGAGRAAGPPAGTAADAAPR